MEEAQSAAVAADTPLTQSAALATAETIPTALTDSAGIQNDRAVDESTALAGGPAISVTVVTDLDEDAQVEDEAGQATIVGAYAGTPAWSLSGDDAAKYTIDEETGAIEVADTLEEGTDSITVSVSGVTPAISDVSVSITVAAGAA